MQKQINTKKVKSQEESQKLYEENVSRILEKICEKKKANLRVIKWLNDAKDDKRRAMNVFQCASETGFYNQNGIARVAYGTFCRERVCTVCAWRRQVRFVEQMRPCVDILRLQGYEFLFSTLTIKNVSREGLQDALDTLLHAYDKLGKRKEIKRAFHGRMRSVEVTYNEDANTFHPHIHMLIAVQKSYFKSRDYISQARLREIWQQCIEAEYLPQCDIRKVTDEGGASLECMKYALKPTLNETALDGFFEVLSGRRLVSFSGAFAKYRKVRRLTDFDQVLTDAETSYDLNNGHFDLYGIDVNGGFSFYMDSFHVCDKERNVLMRHVKEVAENKPYIADAVKAKYDDIAKIALDW